MAGSESDWIDAALLHGPEIQSRAWELAALGEEMNLSSLSFLDGGEIGAHGEHNQAWAVGPTVTTPLPIFDFGQAARARARAMKAAAYHELVQQRLQVMEDVRRAFARYDASRAALQTAQERLVPLQQQQRDMAENAYKSGDSDLATLLLAENGLWETRSKLIGLQQQLAIAMIHLDRTVGGAGVTARLRASATNSATTNEESMP